MPSSPLLFVTGNQNKFAEAQAILGAVGFTIEQYPHRPPEIQSDSLEEIARHCCEQVLPMVQRPVFVEDAGLFIRQLEGFPGPFSSYILRTIGNEGILKLMQDIDVRSAVFRSAVAYAAPNQSCIVFVAETHGVIAHTIRGTHWGFDPIYVPHGGGGKTYAEMGLREKNRFSHRARALTKLADWLRERGVAT